MHFLKTNFALTTFCFSGVVLSAFILAANFADVVLEPTAFTIHTQQC